MFEYAISCGEGTLVEYGKISQDGLAKTMTLFNGAALRSEQRDYVAEQSGATLRFSAASPDCQTGI